LVIDHLPFIIDQLSFTLLQAISKMQIALKDKARADEKAQQTSARM